MKKTYFICVLLIAGLIGKPSYAQFTKLLDFAGTTNGSAPYGSLISDGTFLYGMTYGGGTSGDGTIFKIMPDGSNYVKLLDFSGSANGSSPRGSFISDGTFLYGMTSTGGIWGAGTIFKIKPDGTGYIKLFDFGGGATNGSSPYGDLISDGTFLYGMTKSGGTNGYGIIFKIKPDGTSYTKLLDFTNIPDGKSPNGSLIFDGTFLYGMTRYGGINGDGIIFKIMPDGTGYVKLLDFAGSTNGSGPIGSLISDGTFLYGTTATGGTNSDGVIFKIKPDGSNYVKLLDFATFGSGSSPNCSLIFDGTFLYGMTPSGGTNVNGTIFKIKPDGTNYLKLLDFAGATNGSVPYGSLISDGSFLYGMTRQGGQNNLGVVFKQCIPLGVTASSTATTVCAGTGVTLTGGGATTYAWSAGVTDGVAFIPPSGITTYTVTGTNTTTGCQGVATKTITVNPLPTITPVATATTVCIGDSVILNVSGNADTYSWSGGITNGVAFVPPAGITTYTVTGTNTTTGCQDSTTKIITVNTVDNSVTQNNNILTANANGATYQWLNCNNGFLPITGATNQSYTATSNGNYAVIVTQSSCSDTSSCYNVSSTGIANSFSDNGIIIYPNPSSGKFQVQSSKLQVSSLEVYNVLGEKVYQVGNLQISSSSNFQIDLSKEPVGIYFIQMLTEGNVYTRKIMISH